MQRILSLNLETGMDCPLTTRKHAKGEELSENSEDQYILKRALGFFNSVSLRVVRVIRGPSTLLFRLPWCRQRTLVLPKLGLHRGEQLQRIIT